jgi:hypothetical protein
MKIIIMKQQWNVINCNGNKQHSTPSLLCTLLNCSILVIISLNVKYQTINGVKNGLIRKMNAHTIDFFFKFTIQSCTVE